MTVALIVTKLFRTTHTTICLWRFMAVCLIFLHLFAVKTSELDYDEGCPHNFAHIVQICIEDPILY